MYLLFAVNANGKPKSWKADASETFNWPRLIQIAWLVYDEKKVLLDNQEILIQPEGFEIYPESERYHGISTAIAKADGIPLEDGLKKFIAAVDKAEYCVAHNLKLAKNTITAECTRSSIEHNFNRSEFFSLMEESTFFCKIPAPGGRFKWPNLMELFQKCFGKKYGGAGNAKEDVKAMAFCFFKLLEIRAIEMD